MRADLEGCSWYRPMSPEYGGLLVYTQCSCFKTEQLTSQALTWFDHIIPFIENLLILVPGFHRSPQLTDNFK